MVLVRPERPGRPSSSHALTASATVYVREDRGARLSSSHSSAIASRTAALVGPITRRRIRFPVGVEAQIDRASPPSYAATVEPGVQCTRGRSGALKDAPRVAGTPGIQHLGLHQWDHFETTIDLLEDPHVL